MDSSRFARAGADQSAGAISSPGSGVLLTQRIATQRWKTNASAAIKNTETTHRAPRTTHRKTQHTNIRCFSRRDLTSSSVRVLHFPFLLFMTDPPLLHYPSSNPSTHVFFMCYCVWVCVLVNFHVTRYSQLRVIIRNYSLGPTV